MTTIVHASQAGFVGVSVASVGKNCRPHNQPANFLRRGEDVFCVVCGGWIGKAAPEPTKQPQTMKGSK